MTSKILKVILKVEGFVIEVKNAKQGDAFIDALDSLCRQHAIKRKEGEPQGYSFRFEEIEIKKV